MTDETLWEEPSNETRAAAAEAGLFEYARIKEHGQTSIDYEEATGDLITDLMHLAKRDRFDFERALRCARINFEAEDSDA